LETLRDVANLDVPLRDFSFDLMLRAVLVVEMLD
jgi:hypothetical protein